LLKDCQGPGCGCEGVVGEYEEVMTALINIRRLKTYRLYKGDGDMLLRAGSKRDRSVFGDDLDKAWAALTSIMQDLELIQKGLASAEYTRRTVEELKNLCDPRAYRKLTKTLKNLTTN